MLSCLARPRTVYPDESGDGSGTIPAEDGRQKTGKGDGTDLAGAGAKTGTKNGTKKEEAATAYKL